MVTGLQIKSSLAIAAAVALAGCADPLPEHYGVYIKRDGEYHNVRETEDPGDRLIDDDSAILVFDKGLSTGRLDPSEEIRLFRSRVRRYEIESAADGESPNRADVAIHEAKSIDSTGRPMRLQVRPIPDESEMVEAVFAEPISPGVYSLQVGDAVFTVFSGIEPDQVYSAANPSCVDRRTWTHDIDNRFSWNAFRRLAEGGLAGGTRSASGKVVMREEEWSCGKSDEYLAQLPEDDGRVPSGPTDLATESVVPEGEALPPEEPVIDAPLVVTLHFTQECWVEARVDGQPEQSRLFVGGESIQLGAEESVTLSLGNGGGVDIRVNDMPLDLDADTGGIVEVTIDLDTLAPLRGRAG